MLALVCLAALTFTAEGLDLDPVHTALKKIGDAGTNWPAEQAARQQLVALGEPVVRTLQRELATIDDARVRRACYDILCASFAQDERTPAILVAGLGDKDDGIRYVTAFQLGTLKAYAAHRQLQVVADDTKESTDVRLAAAKSLAELGESHSLRLLYQGATADRYMERYMASIGLKALSGKNLDDFGGYSYAEGCFVSSGLEISVPFDALQEAERKANRFAAAVAYFGWLKAERPDLYKHLTPSFSRNR